MWRKKANNTDQVYRPSSRKKSRPKGVMGNVFFFNFLLKQFEFCFCIKVIPKLVARKLGSGVVFR